MFHSYCVLGSAYCVTRGALNVKLTRMKTRFSATEGTLVTAEAEPEPERTQRDSALVILPLHGCRIHFAHDARSACQ